MFCFDRLYSAADPPEMSGTISDLQKKKKTRFPLSRIKKLMQLNDEVGKTTATVPVIVSKGIELFLADIVAKTMKAAEAHKTFKIQPCHLQEVIENELEVYGFLKDIVVERVDE